MTTVEGDAPKDAPTGQRIRRVRTVVIALLTLAVLTVAVWQTVAHLTLGSVRIAVDSAPVQCEGTEVDLYPGFADDHFQEDVQRPLVVLEDGMRCSIRFFVVNDGWTDAATVAAGLPMLAEDMAWPLSAVMVNPNGQTRLPDNESAAEFSVEGLSVPPGERLELTAIVDYDPSKAQNVSRCSRFSGAPVYVRVTVLGVTRDVQAAPETPVWYGPGDAAECEG